MTNRRLAMLGAASAFLALGVVYGLQYGADLVPCPLCIFQRIAVALFGVVCLVAMVHGPGQVAARIYAAMGVLVAALGATIALRHVYILQLPPGAVPTCAPELGTLVQMMPLREVVATVLRGDASCADVKGSFLGLSLPVWSAIYFIGLMVGSIAAAFRQTLGRTPSDST
ncbi:disulfide bond formation protein B [Salinisphaera sp. USBA-960]|uniref:disulfide bond formation protein B n=1 Tax=Salinisphaera orenii TaxID=856731 RepID=UPI000DBE2B2D|nr:disulfide bond formation protein B [Salifodinibacter halophilus]NNC25920.1 disulfide bond formation protein B [Salifodinibacter halophilus]